jgi:hypothetical protein
MTAPWGDFDVASDLPITAEVLESLQGRLEDPQQTPPSSSTNPFSAASDRVAPRTITLMDVARAHLKDSEEPFTTVSLVCHCPTDRYSPRAVLPP